MKWFTDLSTRNKLLAAFAPVAVLPIIIIAVALSGMAAIHEAGQIGNQAGTFRSLLNAQRAALLQSMLLPPGPEMEKELADISARSARTEQMLNEFESHYRTDPELAQHLAQMKQLWTQYSSTRDRESIVLIRGQKLSEARALVLGIQAQRYESLREQAIAFSDAVNRRATAHKDMAQAVCIALGLASLVISGALVILLSRLIAHPLEKITALADEIAHGNLEVDFSGEGRGDEVGSLSQAFQRVSRSLKVVAGRARQIASGDLTAQFKAQSEQDALGTALVLMGGNLRTILEDLISAVNVLASSTTEIMASTAQMASSASETAAAVTETTTTVEEVKHASQISSQKAREVSDRAQKAAEISKNGRQAVDKTVEGMNQIRTEKESLVASILQLNAQGKAVGEIIATVDDLAAQSKLLAVNAAIEAAKAGEEGRAFAVVAQEIKALAEQSRRATTQVRVILGEIQKATDRAVLAAEEGSKAVEAGVIQAGAAGESIGELSESIVEAARAAAQIAATSQQQFVGMDQVGLAMENIKTASTQTLISTKQTETAAQQLHELGQKLKQIAERFKV